MPHFWWFRLILYFVCKELPLLISSLHLVWLIHHQIIPIHVVIHSVRHASNIRPVTLSKHHSVPVNYRVYSLIISRLVSLFLLLLLLIIDLLGRLCCWSSIILISCAIAIGLLLIALLIVGLAIDFDVLVVGILDQASNRLRIIDNKVIYIIVINNVCNIGWCLVPLRRSLICCISFSLGNIISLIII